MPADRQNRICIALCTCPDEQTASRLAGGLLEERLAACANIVTNVRSVFRWQGKVGDEPEALMVIKTSRSRYPALESWLQTNHPYDVPEVLRVPVDGGLGAYLDWVTEETS